MWGRVFGVPFICKARSGLLPAQKWAVGLATGFELGLHRAATLAPLEAALQNYSARASSVLNWYPGVALRLCSGISKRGRRMWTYFLEGFCALQLLACHLSAVFSRPRFRGWDHPEPAALRDSAAEPLGWAVAGRSTRWQGTYTFPGAATLGGQVTHVTLLLHSFPCVTCHVP